MWRNFLHNWNGISMFITETVSQGTRYHIVYWSLRSSWFWWCFQGHWFSSALPPEVFHEPGEKLSIALLELYPIVTAAVLWGYTWSGLCIQFYCDNMATVHLINKDLHTDDIAMSPTDRIYTGISVLTTKLLFFWHISINVEIGPEPFQSIWCCSKVILQRVGDDVIIYSVKNCWQVEENQKCWAICMEQIVLDSRQFWWCGPFYKQIAWYHSVCS